MRIPTSLRCRATGRLKPGVVHPPAFATATLASLPLLPAVITRTYTRGQGYSPRESAHYTAPRPSTPHPSIPRPSVGTSEESVFNRLIESLSIERPPLEVDEQFSAAVWEAYSYLSAPYRKSLPLDTHRAIFAAVVPSFTSIQTQFPHPKTRNSSVMKKHLYLHRGLARQWEQRLRTVALALLEDTDFLAHPDSLRSFVYAMGKLAAVGDLDGCVAMLREVRARFVGVGDMDTWCALYDTALRSAVRWLADNCHRRKSVQADLEPLMEVTRGLVQEMQAAGIEAAESTSLSLLDHARWMVQASDDESTQKSYDDILLRILDGGYGLKETRMGWTGLTTFLPHAVKLALIDLLGRRHQLWAMVAAFEAMFADPGDRLLKLVGKERKAAEEKEESEEDIPTLSKMVEKEMEARVARDRETRAQRLSWSQRVAGQPPAPPPTPSSLRFSDYLTPLPTPADMVARHSALPDPIGYVRLRLRRALHDSLSSRGATPPSYIFKTMLHHAWASRRVNDHGRLVCTHIFRTALRTAHADQALFIGRLLSKPVMGPEGEKWNYPPKTRVDVKWFAAAWQIVRWQYGTKRDGREFAPMIHAEAANALERLEQERTVFQEVWHRLEQERLGKVKKMTNSEPGPIKTMGRMEIIGVDEGLPADNWRSRRPLDVEDHLRRLEGTQQQLQMVLDEVDHACGASTQRIRRQEENRARSRGLLDAWDDYGDDDFGQVQERWYVEENLWYHRMTVGERYQSPAFP